MSTLRLILGDQLHRSHSWCKEPDPDVTIVMMEVRSETDYVRHHIQKVACIFAAMRAFADELRHQGHRVIYIKINDPHNKHTLTGNISALVHTHKITRVEYQEPDEWRVDEELRNWSQKAGVETTCVSTEHFYTQRYDLRDVFGKRTRYVMENYYRWMRKRFNVFMEDDGERPIGGKWNYDSANRNPWKGEHDIPPLWNPHNDLTEIVRDIESAKITTIGTIDPADVPWPITRAQALDQLETFISDALPHFGRYQDAMVSNTNPAAWYLYHSRLSFALNTKMLTPHEVVERVEAWWHSEGTPETLSAVEGFIRQIIGWREYVRGIYWSEMPTYASLNSLDQNNRLPSWYWTGATRMNCMHSVITQSLEHAYAHHIQRLMITGVFAMMAEIDPNDVDEWYLGIYIDAFEWVEMPNVRGMSQWADGGKVSTKPYACGGNYINKMSNYCKGCEYTVSKKRDEGDACPFNALYWHFIHRNQKILQTNERTSIALATLRKMKNEDRIALLQRAQWILDHLEEV